MSNPPVFRIDIRQNKSRWPLGRPQRWSWRAVNTGNTKVIARSSENYTNESDCEAAAFALLSDGARVWLSRPDGSASVLREMVE